MFPQYHVNPYLREHTTPTKFVHISFTPRVCNVKGDSTIIKPTIQTSNQLVDTGANVCITNNINNLVDVENIAPFSISVATDGGNTNNNSCTKKGLLPLRLDNGTTLYVPCYYCHDAVDTIISPEAIVESSATFTKWTQTGYKDPSIPGTLDLTNDSGSVRVTLTLTCKNNLYYCVSNSFIPEHDPMRISCQCTFAPISSDQQLDYDPTCHRTFEPVSKARQVESETWLLRLGAPGENQLQTLPSRSKGMPDKLECHPFRSLDFKEQAYIRKQPALKHSERLPECGDEFYMDFGFMRSSTSDYRRPNKQTDRVVLSYDGYTSYLLIVDGKSRRIWSFVTKSKEPPIDIIRAFMSKFGNKNGGLVRTDQGGELARCSEFRTMMEKEFGYIVERTGADSPSQNGAAEIYNDKFAIKVRTLLYMAGLPAKFWSAGLQHAAYLHNRLVHSATNMTPYEAWYGEKPDLSHLKVFGSRVCVKQPGDRRSKLDRHDYTGIFLGYTATDKNILYLDTTTGTVKTSHHAVFDEAWYLQPKRPPAAQLLYDLGLTTNDDLGLTPNDAAPPDSTHTNIESSKWPPPAPNAKRRDEKWYPPLQALL